MAAISAIGQIQQGQQQKEIQDYNARVAENAGIEARQAAEAEEARHRREGVRFKSTVRSRVAGSGVVLEGSPLLALAETAENVELDALTIRRSGSRAEAQALAQAAADRFQGRMYRTAGYFGAATSLLKGATSYGVATGKIGPQLPATTQPSTRPPPPAAPRTNDSGRLIGGV